MDAKTLLKGFGKDVLPALAGALGGPFAGVATKFLSQKLLGKSEVEAEELAAAVGGTDILELRKLDYEFRSHMAEMGVSLEQIEAMDRASARERDVTLRTGGHMNRRADVMAYGLLAIVALMILGLYFMELPADANRDIINIAIGALLGSLKQVFNFEFGSSRGSKDKDRVLGVQA